MKIYVKNKEEAWKQYKNESRSSSSKHKALKQKMTPPSGAVNRLEGYVSRKTGKRHYDVAGMSPEEKAYHNKNKNATHRGELK